MYPADFREALYSTWMTGRPWGMKLNACDSDEDDVNDEVHFLHWLHLCFASQDQVPARVLLVRTRSQLMFC